MDGYTTQYERKIYEFAFDSFSQYYSFRVQICPYRYILEKVNEK